MATTNCCRPGSAWPGSRSPRRCSCRRCCRTGPRRPWTESSDRRRPQNVRLLGEPLVHHRPGGSAIRRLVDAGGFADVVGGEVTVWGCAGSRAIALTSAEGTSPRMRVQSPRRPCFCTGPPRTRRTGPAVSRIDGQGRIEAPARARAGASRSRPRPCFEQPRAGASGVDGLWVRIDGDGGDVAAFRTDRRPGSAARGRGRGDDGGAMAAITQRIEGIWKVGRTVCGAPPAVKRPCVIVPPWTARRDTCTRGASSER
jgi:hypothetical protein